jgi:hypothetical protein
MNAVGLAAEMVAGDLVGSIRRAVSRQ